MMCVFLGCYWSLSSRWSAALPSYSPIYKDPGGRGLVGWLGDTSAAPSGGAVGRGRCGVASAQSAAGLERAGRGAHRADFTTSLMDCGSVKLILMDIGS